MFGKACKDGDAPSSCLQPLSATKDALRVETDPCPGGKTGCRNWKLFSVAPVLAGGTLQDSLCALLGSGTTVRGLIHYFVGAGWALIGEEDKYVALSPQRIVAAHTSMDATDPDASDALLESELQADGGLHFTIVGVANETVAVTVVAPSSNHTLATDDGNGIELAKAMAGKVIVVTTTLGLSGEAVVSCLAGLCKVSPA